MSEVQELRPRRAEPPSPPAIIWLVALVFVGFEGLFQVDEALWGMDLRWDVYRHLAFFDLYFEAALQGREVPFEFYSSFLTYGFLHGGMLHLVMNGVIFLSLGGLLANRLGAVRFMLLFLITSAAGALAWGLIYSGGHPAVHLVGASGGIFGFFGALKRWEWRYIRATGASPRRFWGTIIALTLMNVLLFFFYPGGGGVAWEAHLGGFIAGWLIAPALAPRFAAPSPI